MIAEEMKAKQDEQEREVNEWLVRHESLALRLTKINPGLSVVEPGHNSFSCTYRLHSGIERHASVDRGPALDLRFDRKFPIDQFQPFPHADKS